MQKNDFRMPDQILQEALRRETDARDFYSNVAENCHVDFVKKLLERLKNEESRHISLVQEMISRLNLGKSLE
jgi:rubrerythrin